MITRPGWRCCVFLRDRCGKERVSKDDALRLESIRQGAAFREQASGGAAPESFLQGINAVVTFDLRRQRAARLRAGEQDEPVQSEWPALHRCRLAQSLAAPGAVLAAVSYEDKSDRWEPSRCWQDEMDGGCLNVEAWVMSCRAFARRIEHQALKMLFDSTGAAEMRFGFTPTAKNGPPQDFFADLLGEEPKSEFGLTRSQFEADCPDLYHEVREMRRAEAHG